MRAGPRAVTDLDFRRLGRLLAGGLFLAIVFLFVVASVPQLAGADESYVVLSDSMSPTIEAGAVVFVSEVPAERIQTGHVITFHQGDDGNSPVTHRVVGIETAGEQRSFVTKGDANEDPDASTVPARAVVGLVGFHIPLIGYVVSFANTGLGLLALVVIPALVLIVLELRDFWRATAKDSDETTESDGIL